MAPDWAPGRVSFSRAKFLPGKFRVLSFYLLTDTQLRKHQKHHICLTHLGVRYRQKLPVRNLPQTRLQQFGLSNCMMAAARCSRGNVLKPAPLGTQKSVPWKWSQINPLEPLLLKVFQENMHKTGYASFVCRSCIFCFWSLPHCPLWIVDFWRKSAILPKTLGKQGHVKCRDCWHSCTLSASLPS